MTSTVTSITDTLPDVAQVAAWLRLFHAPGEVAELRAIGVEGRGKPHTESGYFDHTHLEDMARAALRLSKISVGVYHTLNPLLPDTLAVCSNRVKYVGDGDGAGDRHVLRRKWLLVDCDPERLPAKISASVTEKSGALSQAQQVRDWLHHDAGWPDPIFADSGNGYHLYYRIDLPADDSGLVKRVLEALAQQFDTAAVKIDRKVFNPSRITKLPGTLGRKGDSIPERPHRVSKILEVPSALAVVSAEQLQAIAVEVAAKPTSSSSSGTGSGRRLMVDRWLTDCGIEFKVKPDAGRTIFSIDCPFHPEHRHEANVTQFDSGALSASCFHNGCSSLGWTDFRDRIGKPKAEHWEGGSAARPEPMVLAPPLDEDPPAPASDDVLKAADDPHRLARLYLAKHVSDDGLRLRYWTEEFYLHGGTAYQAANDGELKAGIVKCIEAEFNRLAQLKLAKWAASTKEDKGPPPTAQKVTKALVANVMQALASLCILPTRATWPAWIQPPDWVSSVRDFDPPKPAAEMMACRNGLLHLPTLELHPHTSRFWSLNALDYAFNREAPAPSAWLQFLQQLWPEDRQAIDALQEWFGYVLLPDTRQQKILMMVGPRRSGKGTIARVLRGVVGIDNTAGPTLASLSMNFGLQPLLGKPLAIISDARLSGRTDAAVVTERLLSISGEDGQTVDRKHMAPMTVKLPTRFMVLTNELPRLTDASGALVSRMIILRMTSSWYGKEDTNLTDRLLAELPGVLLWAIEGYKRLQHRGHFVQPESATGIIDDLEDLASPIGAFLRERCDVGPANEVSVADLFAAWRIWCESKGRKDSGSEQTFGRDLRAALPTLTVRQRRTSKAIVRVYGGLRLGEWS